LAHAYLAAKSGCQVVVFERNPVAMGASVRNFGRIWPMGQPAGKLHETALRSRQIWLEVLYEAELPYVSMGSLHAAYRDDEAAVGQEFSEKAPSLGYDCEWLTLSETLERCSALRPENLLGALWSSTELTIDPRQVIASLPKFLASSYRVQFRFNTAVTRVESGALNAGGEQWEANSIIIASGDDFQTLFPEYFERIAVTRCKLQICERCPSQEDGHWAHRSLLD